MYLGDYASGSTVHFMWSTNAADGSSITRTTDGTVSVYKADNVTQTTTGVTDTEDFDSLTGIHHCKIVTSDAFYVTATDYTVVLSAATIDGKTVNAVLAHFSIQNRYMRGTDSANTTTPPTAAAVADAVWDETAADHTSTGTTGKTLANAASAADASTIAAAVWDITHSSHQLTGSTGESLAAAGTAGDPWSTALPGSYIAGKAGYILGTYLDQKVSQSNQSPGAGAIPFTYTITDFDTSDPIPDVAIWATSNPDGTGILASGISDLQGKVTFYLPSGTVYIWRAKRGWDFVNPDTETVA